MSEQQILPGMGVAGWKLGRSVTVVVPDDRLEELVGILSEGLDMYLNEVCSANGVQISFKPENRWTDDADSGTGWMQLHFARQDKSGDHHFFAQTITRAQARKLAAGLSGESPVLVPLTMNYIDDDDGTEDVPQVPVYFVAEYETASVRDTRTRPAVPPVSVTCLGAGGSTVK